MLSLAIHNTQFQNHLFDLFEVLQAPHPLPTPSYVKLVKTVIPPTKQTKTSKNCFNIDAIDGTKLKLIILMHLKNNKFFDANNDIVICFPLQKVVFCMES